MSSLLLIAKNGLRSTLRSKAMYVIVFLCLLSLLPVLASLSYMQMAAEAGEEDTLERMQLGLIESVFSIWHVAAIVLGLFLGATAVSSEIRSRTIVIVLSKPVERWSFLIGKWLGTVTFLLVFMAAGFLVGLGIVLAFGLQTNFLFWIGILHRAIAALLHASLALALSTILSPVLAGTGAFFAQTIGAWSGFLLDHSSPYLRYPAMVGYYLLPSRMPADPISQSFDRAVLNPEHGVYLNVLVENAGYAAAALLVACLIFARREIALR